MVCEVLRFNTEIIILRVFQVVIFNLSYVFTRTVLDLRGWREQSKHNAILVSMLLVVILSLAWASAEACA